MQLENLVTIKKKSKKIIGRGRGSGKGSHTVGRGTKGQKSRTGYKAPSKLFEGGQNPIFRRIPKLRGFERGYFKVDEKVLSLSDLDKFEEGTVVNEEYLLEQGLISKSKSVKVVILNNGDISKKIQVEGLKVSKKAKEKIIAKGGSVN